MKMIEILSWCLNFSGLNEPCGETRKIQWFEFQKVATKDDVQFDHPQP